MASRNRTVLNTFDEPIASPAERRAAGKALRERRPRTSLGEWVPSQRPHDSIELFAQSNASRVPDLVPLRVERMGVSPFTFFRGSALLMAHDLALTDNSGLQVRLCGDAHLANFGVFASPERRLVFDLNDFDEAAPGPFEWDVKRLAASIVVASRDQEFDRLTARRTVLDAVASYRDWMERYSQMTHLDVWYSHLDVGELVDMLPRSQRGKMETGLQKVAGKTHMKALSKLTDVVDGRRRILDDAPVITHVDHPELQARLQQVLRDYRRSLSADKQALFDRYRFVDFARKVVGVGSVGTRCWILALQGPNGGPLFLQVKEARPSAVSTALGVAPAKHEGRRVVEGQKMLQSTSDVMLGWSTDATLGHHYYVRQLWDSKGSVNLEGIRPKGLALYAQWCGWALARAHARTGDSVAISGYIGTSERFGESMADFAELYADQNDIDHGAFVDAAASGRFTA